MKTEDQKDREATRWNHRPTGPVALNPMFDWPPKFLQLCVGTRHIGWQPLLQPLR